MVAISRRRAGQFEGKLLGKGRGRILAQVGEIFQSQVRIIAAEVADEIELGQFFRSDGPGGKCESESEEKQSFHCFSSRKKAAGTPRVRRPRVAICSRSWVGPFSMEVMGRVVKPFQGQNIWMISGVAQRERGETRFRCNTLRLRVASNQTAAVAGGLPPRQRPFSSTLSSTLPPGGLVYPPAMVLATIPPRDPARDPASP